MSTISSSTTSTTAYKVTADTTGTLVLQTGATPTTAVTIGSDQSVTFAGTVSLSGNQTTTGNLTVNGNTTLGDASTDTILMTGAPSIGGAGLGMGFGFKNRIINGAMVIDQRNAGASVTPADGAYILDRWNAGLTQASKFTVQQSSTAPTGFVNSLLVTSSSAYSVGSGDLFRIGQYIEGLNATDFAWGTASAVSVTLSFWVRSSLTGTFGGALANSAFNRSYPFTYTISSANTWEQKTVTITGDTSGTWLTTNGIGIRINFSLGAGSSFSGTSGAWAASTLTSATGATSVVGTNGATWYITGVQLEKGSTATSFDYRPYGTELALCQRYYYKNLPGASNSPLGTGPCISSTASYQMTPFPVIMRNAPTALEQSGTAADYNTLHAGSVYVNTSVPTFITANTYAATSQFANAGAMNSVGGAMARTNSTTGYLAWSAEL
jgi:hypothetical protein